jgi:hypothetical protein
MAISFGDNVRIVSTRLTQKLGLAGLFGQVYGETRPSVTGVQVFGETADDYAINVQIEDRPDAVWFAPQLLEFMHHAPGTEIVIGTKRLVRTASGEWVEG